MTSDYETKNSVKEKKHGSVYRSVKSVTNFFKDKENVQLVVGLTFAFSGLVALGACQRHLDHKKEAARMAEEAREVTYIDVKGNNVFLFDTDHDLKSAEVVATAGDEKLKAENAGLLFGHEGETHTITEWKGMTRDLTFKFLNNNSR